MPQEANAGVEQTGASDLSDYSPGTGAESPQLQPNRAERKVTFLLGFVGGRWCA